MVGGETINKYMTLDLFLSLDWSDHLCMNHEIDDQRNTDGFTQDEIHLWQADLYNMWNTIPI